jgi:hypothetical protein
LVFKGKNILNGKINSQKELARECDTPNLINLFIDKRLVLRSENNSDH